MTSLQQAEAEGRVYHVTLANSDYNGETVEVSMISSSTADGKKTVIKNVTIFDTTGEFTIEDADLIALFGSSDRANQVDFAIYDGNNTQLLGDVYTFSDTTNSFDTYLLPIIVPDLTFQNNDRRVTLTFNVETIGEVNGIINHPNNDIVSVTYYIQDRSSNGLTKETVLLNTGITAVPDDVYGNDGQTDDYFFKTSGGDIRTGEFILSIGDLSNGTIYEASLLVTNKAGNSSTMDSVELLPSSQPQPVTQLKINTLSSDDFATTTDASSVNISGTWLDNDALSFRSFDVSGTSTFIDDASDSLVKIRIGTTTDISNAQGLFDATSLNLNFVEFYLTNLQLGQAISPEGYALSRDINLIDELGKSYADLIVNGVGLTVQVVHDYKAYSVLKGIFTQEEADAAGFQQGVLSDEITAYIQTQPVLADIVASVTVSTGDQEFVFDGQILSKDSTNATLEVTNGSTEIRNASVSLTDVTIDQQSVDVSYAQIVSNQDITATLSVPDRNNLYSGGDAHTYTATKTFTTSKFRTPTNESAFTFTGNLGDADQNLHTVLTNVNNETDNLLDSDQSVSNVTWKLFNSDATDNNGVLTGSVLVTNTYVTLDEDVNISYAFDVAASYYLQIQKRCVLDSAILDNYNNAGANLTTPETTVDVFSVHQGPIFFMQNPDLSAILVDVDVSTGNQTFFFNGQILSLDSSGATLEVTNGSTVIINGEPLVLTDAVINEQSVSQIFNDIVTDQLITATLTQPDRNGTLDGNSNIYQYTAQVTFTPYQFKTPDAPSASLAKNLVGNDRTFKATLGDANANYGYDIDNLTAQLADDDSSSGLLSDVSGVFDIDPNETNQAQQNQTINLTRTAEFTVNEPYYLNVSKSYRLDNTVYTRYVEAARYAPVNETGVIDLSPYAGPAYYMGNPEITGIDISEQNITITASTNGTELTSSDAFTLVLVAKDGLAGYATGVLTGNMGTTVTTNGTNAATIVNDDVNQNDTVTYTFDLTSIGINDEASCIGIVDVTNGHSAVSLKNFPATTSTGGLADNFNSSTA